MSRVLAVAEKNIKNAADNKKGCEGMIELEEYRLLLDGMQKDLFELRDSL